jgi:hypothetical protein
VKKFSNKKKHTVFFLLSPCCSPCKQGEKGEKEEQREQGEGRSINTFFYKKRENGYHSMSLVFFFVKKNQF